MKRLCTLGMLVLLCTMAHAQEGSLKQPSYWQANRYYIAAEVAGRMLDVATTRQFMTARCHCFHEVEIGPIADTAWGMTAYSLGVSSLINFGADRLYVHGHRKLARAALLIDAGGEMGTSLHNELMVKGVVR